MKQASLTGQATRRLLGGAPWVGKALRRILGGSCVFMFHRVLGYDERCYDPEMATSVEAFADFLTWLGEYYRVLPLDQLVAERGKSTNGGRPSCAITFDDGWVDNYLHAFPLLQKHQFPATIFLPVRFIGTNRRFWQEQLWLSAHDLAPQALQQLIAEAARRFFWFPPVEKSFETLPAVKRLLMTRPTEEAEAFVDGLTELAGRAGALPGRSFMDWEEVRKMQTGGISFGSHTLNHTPLPRIEPSAADREIRQSRRELMERLGTAVRGFAYPWGAASTLTREAVRRAGYDFAVTTHPGRVKERDDRWMLPRIAVSNPILRCGASVVARGRTLFWFARKVLTPAYRQPRRNGPRIKIAFVIDKISEWEGGTERQLHALIRTLDRTYFEPMLCFIFPAPELPPETLPCPARWVSNDESDIPSSMVVRIFRLTRLLHQMRPQIVQSFFMEGVFGGILAARLSRVPRIVGSARNAGYWKNLRHRIAFRSVACLAHRWQCNSRALWNYVRNHEGVRPERIEILPNAIDLSGFVPASPEERLAIRCQLGLKEAGPVFVSVAALTRVKDLSTLLHAARLLRTELPDGHYLIVGDGPLHQELQQQIEHLKLTRVVHLAGRQADVRPYLAAADFGVLTSRSEGSSNSVLEYMAMGLPSVVSDIAANRDLVDGLFFTPGNARDLARAMLRLRQDLALGAQLRSEYLRAAQEFGLDKFVMRTQSFYARLAAEIS